MIIDVDKPMCTRVTVRKERLHLDMRLQPRLIDRCVKSVMMESEAACDRICCEMMVNEGYEALLRKFRDGALVS